MFFSEFQVNDGACLIYEGNPIPGHGKKCSLLNREFSEPGSFHYNVSRGESKTSSSKDISFGNKVRNRSLTFSEDKEFLLNLEHDRKLYSGYDRQSRAFDTELIDEFDYLKCPCHDTSELHDWSITNDPNGSLTI